MSVRAGAPDSENPIHVMTLLTSPRVTLMVSEIETSDLDHREQASSLNTAQVLCSEFRIYF